MIYEGTNGVQALDLVGRKLPMGAGKYMRAVFHPMSEFIETHKDNPAMAEFTKPLAKNMEYLQQATMYLAGAGLKNPDDAAGGSVEYQRMFALVVMGYVWARQALVAQQKLAGGVDKEFYESKVATARFFMQKILPGTTSLLQSIVAGSKSIMAAPL